MSAREPPLHRADRLRYLAANATTPLMKARLLLQAVEQEQRARPILLSGSMNRLRSLAHWHRSRARDFDGNERERRLKLAEQIERRADELEGK